MTLLKKSEQWAESHPRISRSESPSGDSTNGGVQSWAHDLELELLLTETQALLSPTQTEAD